MNDQKHKRAMRVVCLILAGVFVLSMLSSIFMMLLF